MFGLPHFASNYCFLSFSTAVSAWALATKLAGGLYAAAAASHADPPGTCMGRDCFGCVPHYCSLIGDAHLCLYAGPELA